MSHLDHAPAVKSSLRGLDVTVTPADGYVLVTGEVGAARHQLARDGYTVERHGMLGRELHVTGGTA